MNKQFRMIKFNKSELIKSLLAIKQIKVMDN